MPLPTTFVTGAAGFLGLELVKLLVARGHDVSGLTPSHEAARRVRRAGATAVIGDLSVPGPWQDEAAAEWVFHLPPHPLDERRPTWSRAIALAGARESMDANLLDVIASGATRRVVYVADTSGYGTTGPRAVTEDQRVEPMAWGRAIAPALDRLDGYIVTGLPVITALPGCIYGDGAWFRSRVIEPLVTGRPVLLRGRESAWLSPVHVHDCARALAHLAERGDVAGRYFVVNDEPVQIEALATTCARLLHRPLSAWHLPPALHRLLTGSVVDDYLRADRVFSNVRLRGLRFRFEFPTPEEGLRQVVGDLSGGLAEIIKEHS